MEISDLSWNNTSKTRQNHFLLPNSIRGLIIGKSNCGKTTLLMNLLLQPDYLDYEKLYVFGKSLHQPEYQILKKLYEEHVPKEYGINLFENKNELMDLHVNPSDLIEFISQQLSDRDKSEIEAQFYENSEDVPDPRDLNPQDKNLIIFDDLMLEKQNKCESYYVRGRHWACDCFYIAQSYFKLPRQTIRENANFLCIFRQDDKNLRHIWEDHASDLELKEFKSFCKKCWAENHGFLTIDLTSGENSGKYRKNLDDIYVPKK